MDVNVELSWSDAHANIKDNEFADQLVNYTALEAKDAANIQAVVSFCNTSITATVSRDIKRQQDGRQQIEKSK